MTALAAMLRARIAEHGQRAGTGAVGLAQTVLADLPEHLQILDHDAVASCLVP